MCNNVKDRMYNIVKECIIMYKNSDLIIHSFQMFLKSA